MANGLALEWGSLQTDGNVNLIRLRCVPFPSKIVLKVSRAMPLCCLEALSVSEEDSFEEILLRFREISHCWRVRVLDF